MKYHHYFSIAAALIGILSTSHAQADSCEDRPAGLYCQSASLEHLDVRKNVYLHNSNVLNSLSVIADLFVINSTLGKSYVTGQMEVDNSIVNDMLEVNGNIYSHFSTYMKPVLVAGNAYFKEDALSDELNIIGDLYARDTRFDGPIIVNGTRIYLSDISANTITIPLYTKQLRGAKIILDKRVLIDGDINVEIPDSTVYISKNSQIRGNVHGANLVVF